MIAPFVLLILALTFYFGYLISRSQDTIKMVRYETWHDVEAAPGPHSNYVLGHPLLNQTFHQNKATELHGSWVDGATRYFPEDAYEEMESAAGDRSSGAATLVDALLYRDGAEDNHRYSRGTRERFGVKHDYAFDEWDRMRRMNDSATQDNPESEAITRSHVRIGSDWAYSNHYSTSYPDWSRNGWGATGHHHLRAVRDGFFSSFDSQFDGIDGSNSLEYGSGPAEHPGGNLAGEVRKLYLRTPGYRGPRL